MWCGPRVEWCTCNIRFCNLILDGVPNPKLTESILSELVVMVPIVAKLIWFTDGELVSHKSVQQFSIKHVLVCELTAGSPLQKKHADAADLFGCDRFVFYLGEHLTVQQLRAFEAKHSSGIKYAKGHVEARGISSSTSNNLTIKRNSSVVSSASKDHPKQAINLGYACQTIEI